MDSETTVWQLSCFPSWPQYCRATPTECLPFFGNPVSSMIEASIASFASILGSAVWRSLVRTALSDQGAMATKCSNHWCFAGVQAGAGTAPIGSTLLRSPGSKQPSAVVVQGYHTV